jgi:hypothetical protein
MTVATARIPGGVYRIGAEHIIDCKVQCPYRNWSHRAARHITIGFRIAVAGR